MEILEFKVTFIFRRLREIDPRFYKDDTVSLVLYVT